MNKVKSIRAKLGLTQRELADRVGTSQQQIQRIETGKIAARLGLAKLIAAALEKPLSAVFPGAEQAIMKVKANAKGSRHLLEDERLDQIHETGVEFDPSEHFFKVWMRGHVDPFVFAVTAHEKRRLFSIVQDELVDSEAMSFIVFDSVDKRIAINLAELVTCQFLFNPLGGFEESNVTRGLGPINSEDVLIFQGGVGVPMVFCPEADDPDSDPDGSMGYFNEIFFRLELSPEPSERVHFEDEDGESVFVRLGSLALLSVPLWVVDADELDTKLDQIPDDGIGVGDD